MPHYVPQDSERARGQREGEDGPAGRQPLREEAILLLTVRQSVTTHTVALPFTKIHNVTV